jgi:hypothetical protein
MLLKYDREELYQKVWERPMLKVAEEYGVSSVALGKVCRKLAVPVPGRGHWAKLAHGHTGARNALRRQEERGLVEHLGKKIFINRLVPDFSGRELINTLRPESYLSLETVLRDSGISTQSPTVLTCVTPGRPGEFRAKSVSISFRRVEQYER